MPVSHEALTEALAAAMPGGEALLAAALQDLGLPEASAYTPEEVARLGEALMRRAQGLAKQSRAEVAKFEDNI